MIIEDEQNIQLEQLFGNHVHVGHMYGDFTYYKLKASTREIENVHTHFAMRNDIIDHLSELRGQNKY